MGLILALSNTIIAPTCDDEWIGNKMNEARIYKPAKSAMQSGRGKTAKWVLEFEPADAKKPDSLMGWSGSTDTRSQLRMPFDTLDAAVAFAEKKNLAYHVRKEHVRTPKVKVYADNFKYTG